MEPPRWTARSRSVHRRPVLRACRLRVLRLGHRREDEDGDLPRRLLLVVRVVRVGRHRALPPRRLLLARHFAGEIVAFDRSILQLDVRVLLEIVVPDGVLWRASERRDHRVLALVFDAHQRCFAQLSAASANGGHHDDGHAAQGVPFRAPRLLEALGLLACPVGCAWFVFSNERHRRWISFAARRSCHSTVREPRPCVFPRRTTEPSIRRRPPVVDDVEGAWRVTVYPSWHESPYHWTMSAFEERDCKRRLWVAGRWQVA